MLTRRVPFLFELALVIHPGEQRDVSAAYPEMLSRLDRLRDEHLRDTSKPRARPSPTLR